MRLLTIAAGFCMLSAGCAREPRVPHEDREVVAVANEPTVEITESAPPPVVAAEAGRPRLSHVVTLGAGTPDAEYYGPDGAPRGQPQQGPAVVINNNVNVGGYGYGGYYGGYYGGGYATGTGTRGSRSQSHSESGTAYAPTGFEGAGRTAGQGQTPGVGGNWPAAPSSGPRAQK